MPASNNASSLDFWIQGTSDYAANIPLQKISDVYSSSGNKGTFSFNFEPSYYRLTLYAVTKNSEVTSDTILMKAKASVDLRANDEINFYLSSYGIEGNGHWSLFIYSGNWTLSADYEDIFAGIYNKSSGVLESYTNIARDSFNRTEADAEYNFFAGNSSVSELPGGTYLLKLIFTNKTNGTKFYYTDDLVLFANQTLSARIVVPDIMQSTPRAPDRLRAGYNPLSDSDFVYETEFCWNDNSNNEHGFELELMDITSVCNWNTDSSNRNIYNNKIKPILFDYFSDGNTTQTAAFMDELWQDIIDSCPVTTQTYDCYSRVSGGSLEAGSTFVVIKLHFGKNYIARVRAVNASGSSDNAYLNIALSDFSGNSGFSTTAWNLNASSLSRYYVSYYLNGGRFYDGTNDVSSSVSMYSVLTSKVYSSQMRDSANFTNLPSPLDIEYMSERKSSLYYKDSSNVYYIWEKWLFNGSSDFSDITSGQVTMYSGCENLYLYAYYESDAYDSGHNYLLRTSSVPEAKDADIVVTAHPASATNLIPFQNDTETEGSPIYLNEAIEVNGKYVNLGISKNDYRYLNFMLNTTRTGATSVNYMIAEQGGIAASINTKAPIGYIAQGGGSADFIYCQIDLQGKYDSISSFESEKIYCVTYEITQENTKYKLNVTFSVTD